MCHIASDSNEWTKLKNRRGSFITFFYKMKTNLILKSTNFNFGGNPKMQCIIKSLQLSSFSLH